MATAQGRNVAEIRSARQAVDAATATFGPEHPATAMMLRNLALAMEQGGYYGESESYAKRSLTILEATFGSSDVSLVPALNVLVETYAVQGRLGEAKRLALRAVAIGPDAGPHYATALHNLAAVMAAEGKTNEAAEFFRQAMAAGHPYEEGTQGLLSRAAKRNRRLALVP